MPKIRFRDIAAKIPILDEIRIRVLAGICHHGIAFVDRSYRITRFIAPQTQRYIDEGKPFLIALYHDRMVGLLRVMPDRGRLRILVSRSRDGEIISRALELLGFTLARGSPGRRAVEGAKQLIDAARRGQILVMTVDGPRGPRHEVKPGIIRIAELTGLPIVPFVCRSRSSWWLWGWDRFMGPQWSSPMVHLMGDPLFVPQQADESQREQARGELEERLTTLRRCADKYYDDAWNGSPIPFMPKYHEE